MNRSWWKNIKHTCLCAGGALLHRSCSVLRDELREGHG